MTMTRIVIGQFALTVIMIGMAMLSGPLTPDWLVACFSSVMLGMVIGFAICGGKEEP